MAAQAWKLYNSAKHFIGTGGINLSATTFHVALFQSASDAATYTSVYLGDLSSQVASVTGYAATFPGGKVFTSERWTSTGLAASAKQHAFDVGDVVWTATGTAINNIKFAVIYATGASAAAAKLLCFASLTSTEFDLAKGNTLTLQIAATGVFTLT